MQNGKGSKPRPISDYNKFIQNWEEINWDSNTIRCYECGMPYDIKDKEKYMKQDSTGDWICKGECNYN